MNKLETLTSMRPTQDEYFAYYDTYISKVPAGNIIQQLEAQLAEVRSSLGSLSNDEAEKIHPPYTWTIKQVTGHLIDAERIFADRLHRFAMGEQQAQPGMDQDIYVSSADYRSVSLHALIEELLHCRQANILLLKRLTPEAWSRQGIASGYAVTVRALAWMLAGHIIHHLRIVKQRLANCH